jgi:prepilin-type N-terminal cleavage/methylation domain-containing protein
MMKNIKGFTLVEMLVVVAIIGLLSAVVIVGLGPAREKSRDAKRIADVDQIANWAELNFTDVGGADVGGYPVLADFAALTSISKTGPQGTAYVYERVAYGEARMGACLERDERAAVADCPTTLAEAQCADINKRYCKKLTGGVVTGP